jgi:3'(2'), 5'-bisphosphate nucleotidase
VNFEATSHNDICMSEKNKKTLEISTVWADPLCQIARTAGLEILKIQKRGTASAMGVKQKSDQSLVTDADTYADRYIREQLQKLDPNIPIISEESPLPSLEERQTWGKFWLVDPLDGTRGYATGEPEYTVNIALIEGDLPTVGVIYAPVFDEMYRAFAGQGTFRSKNGEAFQQIYSSPPNHRPRRVLKSRTAPGGHFTSFMELLAIDEVIQMSSSLKFCRLAEGAAEVYARFGPTMEWDTAAGDCIYYESCREKPSARPVLYNKPSLQNGAFIYGLDITAEEVRNRLKR